MNRLFVLASMLMTGLVAAGEVDEVATVYSGGEVEIANTSGSVEVKGWERDEVAVSGSVDGNGRLEFTPDLEKRHTLIRVVDEHSHDVEGADLEIKVPVLSRLNISTVSAEITVEGVKGRQRLQSVSGDLESETWGEDVEARTVSGDIVMKSRDGAGVLTLTTVSGDASVEMSGGEVIVASVSGDLELNLENADRVRLRTTSGDMGIKASLADRSRFDIETINGDLEIVLDGRVNAEFDLETFNGDIDNCFGPESRRISDYAPGNELRFVEGDGESDVRIKTMNGDVYLCNE